MNPRTDVCIRCHPPQPGEPIPTGKAHFVCDRCTDEVRNPRLYRQSVNSPASTAPTPERPTGKRSQADSPKRRRKRTPGTATTVALILLLVASAVGCSLQRTTSLDWGSLHRDTSIDFSCDLRDALHPQTPDVTEP